jgi:hypothetical protein
MTYSGHSPTSPRFPCRARLWVTRMPRPLALVALAALVYLPGCGAVGRRPASSSLVAGRRAGPISRAQLAAATAVGERFATAYARSVYLVRPPRLAGVTAPVERQLQQSAGRVPPDRRGLRVSVRDLHLTVRDSRSIDGGATFDDHRNPPFGIGFTLVYSGSAWRIVSASTAE